MSDTITYYQDNSKSFFDSTVNADVNSLYDHFIKYVPIGSYILDFGCGSGRDTKYFLERGYRVDAIDGSDKLCQLASEHTGITVKCMDYMSLVSHEEYDAIWACASLLHIPSEKLPAIMSKLKEALKPSGIVYLSFKFGDYEGVRDGRYFTDMTSERFSAILNNIQGFVMVEEWFSEDVRPEKNTKWYNAIIYKEQKELID